MFLFIFFRKILWKTQVKEVKIMEIYAIIVTVISVVFIMLFLKWKIAAMAIILFCKENFREPNDKEIADCTKRAADRILKFK